MPSIRVPSALRNLTKGAADVDVAAQNVRDALAELDKLHPGIAARVLDAGGGVRPFIKIFVGGEDIGELGGLDAAVTAKDEIAIVPAIAGGAGA